MIIWHSTTKEPQTNSKENAKKPQRTQRNYKDIAKTAKKWQIY